MKEELKQEREELEDDEIELEEEKENEDTAEDGKMSRPACSLIKYKDINRTSSWIALPIIITSYLRICKTCLAPSHLFLFDNLQHVAFHG